jgi:hypothetical protein
MNSLKEEQKKSSSKEEPRGWAPTIKNPGHCICFLLLL